MAVTASEPKEINRWEAALVWCCGFLFLAGTAYAVGVFAGTVVSLLYAFLLAIYLDFIPILSLLYKSGRAGNRPIAVSLNVLCAVSSGALFFSSTMSYPGLAFWFCLVAVLVWKCPPANLADNVKVVS